MSAFAARAEKGSRSNEITAPPLSWAQNVTTHERNVRRKKGIFSIKSLPKTGSSPLASLRRSSGQKSNNIIRNGQVTSIGLLIEPRAKKTRLATYRTLD